MDPLSEVLSLLKLKTYMAGGFDRAGEWSVQFPRYEGIKCYALVSGACWLVVEGILDPLRLETGDCVLLPRGLSFRLANNLAMQPVRVESLATTPVSGVVRTWGGGEDFFGVGAHFAFTGGHPELLLQGLPPVVHIRSEADRAELRWCLERMRQELRDQRPGSSLVAQQLATTMLIQALRLHLEDRPASPGWLFALTHKPLSPAITAMHTDPGHRWTIEQLARLSSMSRSTFALKFTGAVGMAPMVYLTRWRMLLAREKLTESDQSIAAIALSLGYESESAFRNAFRKVVGYPPRQHRRL